METRKVSFAEKETVQTASEADRWNNAEYANLVWTYDFVFDQSLSGKSLKMLILINEYTRECLAVEIGVSIISERVRQVFQRDCLEKRLPRNAAFR